VKTKSEMGEDVYNTLNPVTEGLLRSVGNPLCILV
jgi:hypothetical protein